MSHFTRVRTTLTDARLLAAALNSLGFDTVETHSAPQALYGFQGDVRPQTAEVIVRRRFIGSASNDIGFARGSDGSFEAVISQYDRAKYDAGWLRRLTGAYGHASALDFAQRNGFEVATDEVEADGSRRITLRRTR